MHAKRIVLVALLAAFLLVPAAPALADGDGPDGQVVFGDSFTLESGETMYGDLVVFGGDVTLEEDSEVAGSVVVWGGDVEVAGTVTEDVAAWGGDINLLGTAVVEGDLIAAGGQVDSAEGAEIQGQVIDATRGEWWGVPVVVPFRGEYYGPQVMRQGPLAMVAESTMGLLWAIVQAVLKVIVLALVAGLVAVLWPQPAARVAHSAIKAPLPAFGLGLLTLLVVFALLVSICLTVIGGIAVIVVTVAGLFGWSALGILVGQRLLGGRGHPFWSAALGAGLITLASVLLGPIFCLGAIGGFLAICWMLGAVILTRFGSMDYPLLPPAPPPTVVEE